MPLISCSELHGGDILLKIADGTLFNQFIHSFMIRFFINIIF